MRQPIIATLQFDEPSDAYFQDMRRKYYPPALNLIGAHLTLFHNLPGAEEKAVLETIATEAARTEPFKVTVAGVMRLGRGVVFKIKSDELMALRTRLAETFRQFLVAQDREPFRPHVTIQNKVAPHEAAELHDHLAKAFQPFEAAAEGVQLWRYEGGPWSPVAAIAFQAELQ